MLTVSEIFYSLQGESTYAGLPCVFIRLSGCNLDCSYCDTRYAFEGGEELSVRDIAERVKAFSCNLIELTGGEPLCQPEAIQLMQDLLKDGYKVLLETNGSIDISAVPLDVIRIVDVKLPGSGCFGSFDLANLNYLTKRDELKFVISDREDYQAAVKFIGMHELAGTALLFSAVVGRLAPAQLARWILEDKLPVRLQIQLHKILDIR